MYVAGSEVSADGNSLIAKYWKNGNPVALSQGSQWAVASSIAVSGNDVYVAGAMMSITDDKIHAVYWKNGNPTFLPENTAGITSPSSTLSTANSIFISGSDIYVAGYEMIESAFASQSFSHSALYWKNGKAIYLTIPGQYYNKATSIFVSGQDVYACGTLGRVEARYWKNGTSFYLKGSISEATSIFVSGSDVYVAGSQDDGQPYQGYYGLIYPSVAKYWKNGNPVKLSDGTKNAYGRSIAVSENDVYVAGEEENAVGVWVAKYWKNGNPIILGDVSNYSEANSIFLVKK